jgi:acetamidase/formamidase
MLCQQQQLLNVEIYIGLSLSVNLKVSEKAAVAYFKLLSWHSPGGIEENGESIFQDIRCSVWIFEQRITKCKSAAALALCSVCYVNELCKAVSH